MLVLSCPALQSCLTHAAWDIMPGSRCCSHASQRLDAALQTQMPASSSADLCIQYSASKGYGEPRA